MVALASNKFDAVISCESRVDASDSIDLQSAQTSCRRCKFPPRKVGNAAGSKGVDHRANSMIHVAEESLRLPYLDRTRVARVVRPDGTAEEVIVRRAPGQQPC